MIAISGRRYQFTLTGQTPLLMHADDVMAADALKGWRDAPDNRNVSVRGDDRSPAWTWMTYTYSDGEQISIPSDNIMVCLRQAASRIILKKQRTFKELSQSNMMIEQPLVPLTIDGKKTVSVAAIEKLKELPFREQYERVQKLGFMLDVRRAKVGQAKHVRVRPRFDEWQCSGTLHVWADEISAEVLTQMFDISKGVGLGDWRPGCKTPGSYGRFAYELVQLK